VRTTITIDDAVMHETKGRADKTDRSVSGVVNDILKAHLAGRTDGRPPFRQQTHALGARVGSNSHTSLDFAANMETDNTIDKLEPGK
jgi:hypothetical protein